MPLPPSPMVGTCGFSYQEWRGSFYPPDLPPSRWLGFYAQVFDALELDGTFYRPPSPATVEGWARALPDRFAVAAKAPREITHEQRLEGEPAVRMLRAFAHSLQSFGDRLLAVVLQLPPSLGAGEGRERLERLLEIRPDGLPMVVEVRHRSWHQPWLPHLLAQTGASLARVERPDAPAPLEWTGPLRYGRMLADRASTPPRGAGVQRGTHARDLDGDVDRWAALALGEDDTPVAIFTNNRFDRAAFETAARLRARVGRPAPDPRSLWPEPPLPGLEPLA